MNSQPEIIFPIDKPRGLSSQRTLNRIKRFLPRGTKIGHAGTLDPFATGLLIALVGRGATRRFDEILGQPKTYRATIKLGATTPTLDPTSEETADTEACLPTREQIDAVLPRFIGIIQQTPPIYSALKQQGQPLYALVRKGRTVEVQPRPVHVDAIQVLEYAYPLLQIEVCCGRGTYIRCLARDIAEELGTLGYLTELCRTAIGEYRLGNAYQVTDITHETFSCPWPAIVLRQPCTSDPTTC